VVNDIDGQRRIRALIETAGTFIFRDGVVWCNVPEPGLIVPGSVDVPKIRKKWESGRIRRTFPTLCEISVAGMFDHPHSPLSGPRFDVYSPRYLYGRKWQIVGLCQASRWYLNLCRFVSQHD
jgi:hypothetical protein